MINLVGALGVVRKQCTVGDVMPEGKKMTFGKV